MTDMPERYAEKRQPFGAWLLEQQDHKGWIKDLVKAAKVDPAFPRAGDVDAVRKHLEMRGAEGEMFARLDDAELDYLTL